MNDQGSERGGVAVGHFDARARASRRAAVLFALAWVVGLLVVGSGCASAPRDVPGSTDFVVESVTLRGVRSFEREDILAVLATREDTLNPFAETAWLNRFHVATDARRIEAFYHARGYFDARVVDYEIETDPGEKEARVRFDIEEGDPSFVTSVHYETRRLRQIDFNTLKRDVEILEGDVFSETRMNAARGEMRRRMQENSYAHARVDARAYVRRELHAVEVYFFFDPGPASFFGQIEVRGNRRIPAELLTERLTLKRGRVYRQSLLRLAELELYDMNAFSFVKVEAILPDREIEEDPTEGSGVGWMDDGGSEGLRAEIAAHDAWMRERGFEPVGPLPGGFDGQGVEVASRIQRLGRVKAVDPNVTIRITVTEASTASYKTGGGFGLSSDRSEAYGRAAATWRNVIAPLNRIELGTRAGYAWIPSVLPTATGELDNEGFVGDATVSWSRPGALFNYLDTTTSVGVSRGLDTYYASLEPSGRVVLSRRFTPEITGDFGYHAQLFLTETDRDGATIRRLIPRNYRLGYLSTSVTWDSRNNPLQPLSGLLGTVRFRLGEDFAVGEIPFLAIEPEVRTYVRVGRRLLIAGRVGIGAIVDLGDERLPLPQRFRLGGGESVRGFAANRLSLYDTVLPNGEIAEDREDLLQCQTALGSRRCEYLPVGGNSKWLANVEPRYELGKGWFWLAAFLDAGVVQRDPLEFDASLGGDGIHLSTGGGFRLITPAGPIRADLGYRLTDGPQYDGALRTEALSRWNFFITIGEAF